MQVEAAQRGRQARQIEAGQQETRQWRGGEPLCVACTRVLQEAKAQGLPGSLRCDGVLTGG